MRWLTPYDWFVWLALVALTGVIIRRHKPPVALLAYLMFDIVRDLILAVPAAHGSWTQYAEWWHTLRYFDYILKIIMLLWAAREIIFPVRFLTLLYAASGTLTLALVAARIGLPWHPSPEHDVAMRVLWVASSALCSFLGLYIVFLSEDWPQPASGTALGVLIWAAATCALGTLQLHGHNTVMIRRGYPLAELAMLLAWWRATRPQGQKRRPHNMYPATTIEQEALQRHIAASQRRWASRQATGR